MSNNEIEEIKNMKNGLNLIIGKTIDGMSCGIKNHKDIIGKTKGRGLSYYKEHTEHKNGFYITIGKTIDGMSSTSNVLLQFLLKNNKNNKIITIEKPVEINFKNNKNIKIV